MNVEHCGVEPQIAASLEDAHRLLALDGAVIVQGIGPEAEDARALARALFGDEIVALPPAARVFDGGEQDNKAPGVDHTTRLAAHTDGFGYGDFYPDYLLLDCVRASGEGGESFLIDGYAVLDALAGDAEHSWVAEALAAVAVNQTEQGMQSSISPIVQHTAAGRKMLRKTLDQRAAPDSTDPERDNLMVKIWCDAAEQAVATAPKFKLKSGQAVVVDNYRMLHGRLAYADLNRLMWRVWIWTARSKSGAPDMQLHSDTRYAHA